MKANLCVALILLVGAALASASSASAQAFDTQTPAVVDAQGEAETPQPYAQPIAPTYDTAPLTVQQRTAQARAQQRQLRMASMAWYGMSNARPTATPTPFCSVYSPVWQMPGGRPYAWYNFNRPTYLIYR
jgi:hypothetical protein